MIDLEKIMNMEDEIKNIVDCTNKEMSLFFGENIKIDTVSDVSMTAIILKKDNSYVSPFTEEQTNSLIFMFIDRFFHRAAYIASCALGTLGKICDSLLTVIKLSNKVDTEDSRKAKQDAIDILVNISSYFLNLISALDSLMERAKSISDSVAPDIEKKVGLSIKLFSKDELAEIVAFECDEVLARVKNKKEFEEKIENIKKTIPAEELEAFRDTMDINKLSLSSKRAMGKLLVELSGDNQDTQELLKILNFFDGVDIECDCEDCLREFGESSEDECVVVLGEKKPTIGSFSVRGEKVIN